MSPASGAKAGTILTVLGRSPRYPTRASPILPLEHKPMRPLGSIPYVTEYTLSTTVHHWEMAVGFSQAKNAFVQLPKEGAWKPRHGNRKASWELLFSGPQIVFRNFSKSVGS